VYLLLLLELGLVRMFISMSDFIFCLCKGLSTLLLLPPLPTSPPPPPPPPPPLVLEETEFECSRKLVELFLLGPVEEPPDKTACLPHCYNKNMIIKTYEYKKKDHANTYLKSTIFIHFILLFLLIL